MTVVTTHPPVLVDNTHNLVPRVSNSEVVIVSNETNKTHVNESSTDDECCPSLDSLEFPPPNEFRDKPSNAKKLDDSEVLIEDSSYVINDSGLDVSGDNLHLLDTSHVSVVKIDEEKVQVKDSASILYNKSGGESQLRESTSDLSSAQSGSVKSECGDEIRSTSIIVDGSASKHKMNGQIVYSSSQDDIYKKNNLNGKFSNRFLFGFY